MACLDLSTHFPGLAARASRCAMSEDGVGFTDSRAAAMRGDPDREPNHGGGASGGVLPPKEQRLTARAISIAPSYDRRVGSAKTQAAAYGGMNHKGNCRVSMAEDRTPDPADQPEDDKTPPEGNPPEPYRLGSGGSARAHDRSGKSGDEPDNPFEAFFSSSSGGDMNALAAQLQSAFAMLGGAGSMFTSGPTDAGSG